MLNLREDAGCLSFLRGVVWFLLGVFCFFVVVVLGILALCFGVFLLICLGWGVFCFGLIGFLQFGRAV